MKKTVRLTENELKRMISESVKRVLKEHEMGNDWENSEEMRDFEDEDDFVDEYSESAHKVADMIGDFVYRNHINISDAIKGCELAIEQLGGTY
jgi:hypothetical protein